MTADQSATVDLSQLARWSTSSHKYGYSLENLRDGDNDTFWQSEGPQPHLIDLAFPRKVMVSSVHIQLDHPHDDSYTPSIISIQAGTGVHDLQEVRHLDLDKPSGWLPFPLRPLTVPDEEAPAPEGDTTRPTKQVDGPPMPAHYVRIVILANHLNGKDTHVRGLRVFGQASSTANMAKPELIAKPSAVLKPSFDELPRTKSKQFQTSQPFTFRQPSPSGPSSSGTTKPSKPLKPSHQHRRHAQTSNPADPDDPDGGSPSASEDENGIKRLKPEHIKWVKALEGGEGGFSSPEFKMFEGIR